MHPARRLLVAAVSGLALTLTATVAPAAAMPDTEPVVYKDAAGDLPNLGGNAADRAEARGLDILRVRTRILHDRLIVVSKHRNLTPRNSRVNADRLAIGQSMTMFALYMTPSGKPAAMLDGYTASFGRDRRVTVQQGYPVDCPVAANRSNVDLERDRVRYVIPLTCIPDMNKAHVTAQVIRYKVIRRAKDGTETLTMVTLDQNNKPLPGVALR